jgi:hypothetical protein
MIIMNGWGKGRALIWGVMGIVFIVIGLMSPSIVRMTFIIIGVADLAVAGLGYWFARKADANAQQMGGGGTWVG